MGGFVSKLQGYNFEGEFKVATDVKNGTFCYYNNGGLAKTNADKDTKLVVFEKTTLLGLPALRCIVNSVGSNVVYFVENGCDINTSAVYDYANYVVKANDYCRAHRLIKGDEVIFIVEKDAFDKIECGDTIQPTADGKIGVRDYRNLTIKVNLGTVTGPVSTDILVPYTIECEDEGRIVDADVVVADTHRKINKSAAGTYDTTVATGDCSLSTDAAKIYKGIITYTITQGSAVVEAAAES